MRIKLNTAVKSYAKGQEITIGDEDGIPLDPFWRRRLKDAKIDKSIEIVQNKPTKEKTKITKSTKPDKGNS